MRSGRNRLKVSTFPFLAVLLCAMGALILFLVVFDRRAKIAARNRALEQTQEVSQERERQIARRWQEWERHRQALQARLEKQKQEVAGVKQAVQEHDAEVARQIAVEQAKREQTQKKLDAEVALLKDTERALADRKKQVEASKKTPAARADIVQLGFEVKELEDTLTKMQEVQKLSDNTFSLVPYTGNHGAGRKPIYVEIDADGLIFQPDGKRFTGAALESDIIRGEVAARLAGSEQTGKPYMFCIVRPDGVENYYKAQAAMRRLDIDFGYEFVERDWQIDFNGTNVAEQFARLAKQGSPPAAAGVGKRNTQAGGELTGLPPIEVPGIIATPPPSVRKVVDLPPPTAPTSTGNGPQATASAGKAPAASIGFFNKPSDLIPELRSKPVPAQTMSQRRVGKRSTPGFVPASRPVAPAALQTPTVGAAQGQKPVDITTPPTAVTMSPTSPPAEKQYERMPELAARPTFESEQHDEQTKSPQLTTPPMSPAPAVKSKNVPPVSRLIGNRDFIVTIECTAEQVTVSPRDKTFPLKALEQRVTRDNELAREIRDLIAQRQATVGEGEPAYRPEIRFRIRPEGRRTFYLAYPLVESVGVTMTREDIE